MHTKRIDLRSMGKQWRGIALVALVTVALGPVGSAQTDVAKPATAAPVIPQEIRFSGSAPDRAGDTVEAVFRVYAAAEGGDPMWSETQHVTVDANGSYTTLLGSATQGGLPQSLFAGGQARWLGVSIERAEELPRSPLTSVAYAMKAGDAQTVGGLAAGSLVTKADLAQLVDSDAFPGVAPAQDKLQIQSDTTPAGSGTASYVPLWTASSTLGNSAIYQSGTKIGVGTTTPLAALHVVTQGNNVAYFTNSAAHSSGAGGGMIGYSDSGAALSSGDRMGYFLVGGATDSNHDLANSVGILGFATEKWSSTSQGGALSFATTPDGSTASASRAERMRIDQDGNVGIGTSTPAVKLEVDGAAKFDGLITFAPGQTFPIPSSGVTNTMLQHPSLTVAAGTDLTGGGSVALGGSTTLNLDTTKVPQLAAANTFTGNQTVNGNLGVTGAATITGTGSFLASTSLAQLIVNNGGAATTTTGAISGNSSTVSGTGGLYLAASNAVLAGNNTGLLFVGPTSGQWEQGPSTTGGPTNFMSIALNSSTTAATNISFNTPVGVPVQTGRYGGSFTNTLDDGNNNMTVLGWVWQKGRDYIQSNPSNPAGTSRTSFTMMGLGSTVKLTPAFSGSVVIRIDSEAKNTVDGNGIQFEVFYGTGVAPSNGSSTTGTQAGPTFERDFWGPNVLVGFGTNLKITGLTVGTAYWFDIALKSLGTGSSNATIQNIELYVEEI